MTLRKTKIWNSFLLLVILGGIHPAHAIENELQPLLVEVSQVFEDSSEEATITVLGSPVLIKSDCRAKPCRAEYQVKLQTNGLRSNALLVGTERKKIMLNQFDQFDVP